jgi:hypothetical protein
MSAESCIAKIIVDYAYPGEMYKIYDKINKLKKLTEDFEKKTQYAVQSCIDANILPCSVCNVYSGKSGRYGNGQCNSCIDLGIAHGTKIAVDYDIKNDW